MFEANTHFDSSSCPAAPWLRQAKELFMGSSLSWNFSIHIYIGVSTMRDHIGAKMEGDPHDNNDS